MTLRNMTRDEVLTTLTERIMHSLQTNEVFTRESSIRGIVYHMFLQNYQNGYDIHGDMISDRVADNMRPPLTGEQTERLQRINAAWHEWEYVLNQFRHPEAPV